MLRSPLYPTAAAVSRIIDLITPVRLSIYDWLAGPLPQPMTDGMFPEDIEWITEAIRRGDTDA